MKYWETDLYSESGPQNKREATPKVETLVDTDEICHAAESMLTQIKVVNDSTTVSAIKSDQEQQQKTPADGQGLREC